MNWTGGGEGGGAGSACYSCLDKKPDSPAGLISHVIICFSSDYNQVSVPDKCVGVGVRARALTRVCVGVDV